MTNTTKNKMEENTMANEMEYALIDTADNEVMFCGSLADCESEMDEYGIERVALVIVNKAEWSAHLENRQTEIKEEIYNYFDNNSDEFADALLELDSWNGYLGDDRYFPMEEINEFFTDPLDALTRAYYGSDEYEDDFCPNRDYFRFDGCGNLVSADYPDYSDHLDDYAIDEIIDNASHIDLPFEIDELIEELETVENALNELD